MREFFLRNRTIIEILLLTVLVFGRSITFGFVDFDDHEFASENSHVLAGVTLDGMRWSVTDAPAETANFIPLTWLSLMADAGIWGARASGFHLTNLVLHVANVVLVFLCVRRFQPRPAVTLIVTLLFAIHPLQTETVVWISERKGLLSTTFGLGSLLLWLNWWQTSKRTRLAASCLLFVASLLSKQMFVTLPGVLALIAIWPGFGHPAVSAGAENGRRRIMMSLLPFVVLVLVFSWVAVAAQGAGGAISSGNAISLDARLQNTIVVYVLQVRRLFWPSDLCVYYPHPGETISLIETFACAGILAAITVFAWLLRRREPAILAGWLWYLGTMLPVVGLLQLAVKQTADRYMYFPLIGLSLCVAATFHWLGGLISGKFRAGPWYGRGFVLLVTGALTLMTARQVSSWQDTGTLFSQALAVTTDNDVASFLLGKHELAAGRTERAIELLHEAARINPEAPITRHFLGAACFRNGDYAESVRQLQRAADLRPDDAEIQFDLGNALVKAERTQEAADAFRAAVRLNPDSSGNLIALSDLLQQLRQTDEAISICRQAMTEHPEWADVSATLGRLYFDAENFPLARVWFERSLASQRSAAVCNNLGITLMVLGDRRTAIANFQEALLLEPQNAGARRNLQRALSEAAPVTDRHQSD